MIHIRRVYAPPGQGEGNLFLVDRLWPRGISKERLAGARWLREAAPSNELRTWYGHDPVKWEEFCRRYFAELESHPDAWQPLLQAARAGDITLLFSTKSEELGNAAALRIFLEKKIQTG